MALGSAKGGIWGGLIGACACVARRLPGSLRIQEIRPASTRSSVRFETALRMLYVYWVARAVLLPLAFRLFFVWTTQYGSNCALQLRLQLEMHSSNL